MGDLYKILSSLCEERNITAYRMCKDVGMQPSVMTDLKMGRRSSVKMETADRLATYFNVSVGYLLGNEKKPVPQEDELIKDEFIAFYGEVKEDLDEDDIADLKTFIRMKSEIKRKLAEKK